MQLYKIFIMFTLCMLLAACGGGASSGTITPTPAGDANATITLEKANLSTGEEVSVSARIADVAGRPVAGVKVTFYATASMGTITILQDTTDASGMAYAKLKATSNSSGNTGQVKVSATVSGRAIENTANFYVNVPSNLKLSMLVSSTSLTVGGGTAVTIYVQNQDGTPYLDQVVDLHVASNYGFITGTQSGKVRTEIVSGKNVASVTYWASSSGVAYGYQDVITTTLNYSYESVQLYINPLGTTASVAFNSASKSVLGFGDAATLIFNVTDASGTGRPSQSVSFSVTDMTGTAASTDATVPSSATTDATGSVRIILNAKTGTGTKYVRVKATSGGVTTYSGVFTITENPVTGTVALAVSSTDVKIGSMLTATVTYAPSSGPVPVPPQNVTIKDATGATIASGITDASGKAYINFAPTVAGVLSLYAEIGTLKSAAVTVTVKSTDVSNGALTIAASPTTAKSGDIITATVTYTNPNAITLAGTSVTVTSNNTAVIANGTGTTDATGKAIVNLPVTGTITADTVVTLYASSGTIQSPTTTVTVSPPATTANVLTLTLTPSFTKTKAAPAAITTEYFVDTAAKVVFKDSKGNAIPNATVTLTISSVTANWVPAAGGSDIQVNANGQNALDTDSKKITPSPIPNITTDASGTALIPIQYIIKTTATAAEVRTVLILWNATTTYQSVASSSSGTATISVTNP